MNYLHKQTHTTVPEYMGPMERAMDILLHAARGGTYREDAVSSSGNLAVLDAHIGLLEDAFAETQAKMRRTIAHVKSRRNALLAVSRLPVELFVEIAKLFLDDEDDLQGYSQKMYTLMLVCNQWHRIVHNTPTLWSYLHPWYSTDYIATAVQKSRPSGLSFWQPLDYPVRNSTAYATIVGLLLPEVPRWTDVNISPKALDKQGLLYLSQHAPKVTSFALDLSRLTRAGSLRQALDLFGGHAPQLRTLVLVAVPISSTSSILTRLTSLRLEFSVYIRPSTLDLLQILERCPHLTELYLSDEASPLHATACGQATKLIQLPKLFGLTFNYLDPDMSHSLFNSVAAPNCVKLKLVSAFAERFAAISLPSSNQLSHSLPLILSCLGTAQTIAVQDPSDDSVEITLAADGGRCVEMKLVDYDLSSVLRWLDQVTSSLQAKAATVKFADSAAGDADILDALDRRSLHFLEQHTPQLTSFYLSISYWELADYPAEPLNLFGGYAPRLRHLELGAVPILWTSPILTGLRSLDVTFPINQGPSSLELLHVLQMCPDLTKLYLAGSLPDPHPGGQAIKDVKLPVLKRLKLYDLMVDLALSVLASISAPICEKITLKYLTSRDFDAPPLPSSTHFAQSFPLIHRYLQEAEYIYVQNPSGISREISIGDDEDLGLQLNMHEDHDLSSALEWFAEITPGFETKLANVDFDCHSIGDSRLWTLLDERLNVVWLSTPSNESPSNVENFLDYLAKPKIVSYTLKWPFPDLVDLSIDTDDVRTSRILNMVKGRYGKKTWKSWKTVPRTLPKSFNQLYIHNASESDASRAAITKLVGEQVITWHDLEYEDSVESWRD